MIPNPKLLLMPNIPKPLHGIAPRTVFGQAWWDTQRKIAYAKAGFECEVCGVPKAQARLHRWLEAHERYEIDYARGRMVFIELVALCHSCHNYIHSGRLQMLVQQGEITPERYDQIIAHGDALIAKHGLTREEPPTESAAWSDWRMVYDGQEYGPSSADESAWQRGEWRNWRP